MSIKQDEQDNMRYQRWLADSLVDNLGFDKAKKVCLEQCWYGTLVLLMKEKERYVAEVTHWRPPLTKAA